MDMIVTFEPGTSAWQREKLLQEEMNKQSGKKATQIMLLKEGYPDMAWGYGDEDTEFADGARITFVDLKPAGQ